jgi:biotin carboxylase
MKNKILVLGGGLWQLAIIMKAKEMGFYTIVADISSDAPAKVIADEFLCVDTNDKNKLVDYARRKEIKIVIGEQTDRVVPVAAHINDELHLKGIDGRTAAKFTDKYLMREALRNNGIVMPFYHLVSHINSAMEIAEELGYPLIIKPRSSQSSFGVFKVGSTDDLKSHFDQTLKYSKDETLLIEEFIRGTEVTVEGISIDGVAYPLAISEKEHFSFNDCVAKKLIYPPSFNDTDIRTIQDYIKKIVETLGLVDGIFHAELKFVNHKPYLIEVAARGGGHKIASVIVPHVSGTDMYKCLLKKLNNHKVVIKFTPQKAAILGFFDFKPGKVKAIHGLDILENHPNVHEIKLKFKTGDEIKRASNDTDRIGYYLLLGKNREEVISLDSFINSTIRIEYY